jgi:hypothetical protein
LQTYERNVGTFLDLRTIRDADGHVAAAQVIGMHMPRSTYFFSTKEFCEEQRSAWIADGTITDPEELK